MFARVFVTHNDLLCSGVCEVPAKAAMPSGLNRSDRSPGEMLPCSVTVLQREEQAWNRVVRTDYSVSSNALN